MAKLADESESFESHTISGLLRGAPDLTSNINHVESMFQPASEESTWLRYFALYCFWIFPTVSDPGELIPRPGKDERFDEIVEEINLLEKDLEKELKKFEKSLKSVKTLEPSDITVY